MSEQQASTDGRVLRGQRTREACVDALLRLVAGGQLDVTGVRVAEVAGVSARTLWVHFADLEALHDAAAHELWARHLAHHRSVPGDGPLERRVALWSAQRAEELEHLAPYATAAALREPFSPALRASRGRFVGLIRAEAATVFATELDRDDGSVLAGVVAASAYPCWTTWRHDLGLDVAQATQALAATLRGLLQEPRR